MKPVTLSLRFARPDDVDSVVRLNHELYASSLYNGVAQFDPDHTREQFWLLLNDPEAIILILSDDETDDIVGVLAAKTMPFAFNKTEKSATEATFYILPEYKNYRSLKIMLQAYYYWAKEMGCVTASFGKMKNRSMEISVKVLR